MAGESGGQVSTPVNPTPVMPAAPPRNKIQTPPHSPKNHSPENQGAANKNRPAIAAANKNQGARQNKQNAGGAPNPNATAAKQQKSVSHKPAPQKPAGNKPPVKNQPAKAQAANQNPGSKPVVKKPSKQPRKFPMPPATSPPVVHRQEPEPDGGNEVFNRIITRRLSKFRSVAWEDDLCRNTLDVEPFVNQPPVAGRDKSEFSLRDRQVSDELLAGRDFEAMVAQDTYPIPSADDREGYSPGRDVNYWLSGLADHLKIMDMADELGVKIRSYFDFGCATGRVIRHFCAQTDVPKIWGSDLNARHIRWITEHLPMNVRALANHAVPTLPIADNSIDCISAFSVFTHIDTFEGCWLAELSRILSPGGFAYLTIHNEATWNVLRGEIDNPNNRLVQSMRAIDPDTDKKLMGRMPDTRTVYRFTDFGPYRAQVFHSNKFIHQQWGRFFQVHAILNNHHVRQTVVVLRKK